MVAAYLGIEPSHKTEVAESIDQAAEFIPVETLSKEAFDDLLKKHGLPTGDKHGKST